MATTCFSTVRGKVVRVTQLDECCAVPTAEGLFVVSDGFISVTLSTEMESGDEFIQKNANGALCVNERSPDSLKRLNVEVDWCQVDPDIVSLITGYPIEVGESPGDSVGFRITEGEANTKWALEVWTGLTGAACTEGELCYGYLLIPCVTGSIISGDLTVENAAMTFTTSGYTEGLAGWDVGPWDVVGTPAGPLTDPIAAGEHALLRTTCVAPPTAACGAQSIPATSA